jgi:hypothetical protein
VFTDPSKIIHTSKIIDFNNDGINDLIVVYTDGTVKISKNYGSEPNVKNLEDLLLLAVRIEKVYIGDIDKNGYPDIVILTDNNQLRAYLNKGGIFDVDGYPICLNTNVENNSISEEPEQLDGVDQIFLEDMDNDGALDIVTYDKA